MWAAVAGLSSFDIAMDETFPGDIFEAQYAELVKMLADIEQMAQAGKQAHWRLERALQYVPYGSGVLHDLRHDLALQRAKLRELIGEMQIQIGKTETHRERLNHWRRTHGG